MKFIYRQKFLIISLFTLIGVFFLGFALYSSNQKLLASEKWVDHTKQVIKQSVAIFSDSKDLKINSRDFILTNNSAFVDSMKLTAGKLFTDIKKLKSLTRDNLLQQQRVDSLDIYVHKSFAFALEVVAVRKQLGLRAAIDFLSNQSDSYYSVTIRRVINSLQQQEETLLKQRNDANLRTLSVFYQFAILIFVLMVGFTIVVLMMAGYYLLQNKEREQQATALSAANAELSFQNVEKEKRANELVVANKELSYQKGEKKKRAGELVVANKELSFQNDEKEKRAAELIIADEELLYQTGEKSKRAEELVVANKELSFQNDEKEKRAEELIIANKELLFQNNEKEKRAAELAVANVELSFQNEEKEKRAAELAVANVELSFQNEEKEKRAAELAVANVELSFQNEEKEKRAAELVIANVELFYQNKEKQARADELAIANEELLFQNSQKEQRAAELAIANKELIYQNKEREMRAVELAFANEELIFQNDVRKMAEKNLSQSESRLKEAQALAKVGNFEVDVIKEIEVWSDEMYNIYGITKTNATPSKELLFSFIHPDDLVEVREAMKKSTKSFNAFAAEFRFIRNDDALRYGYIEARFDWNSDKELIRIYGIIQDVTERKLAEIERKKILNDLMTRNSDLEQFAYIISHNLRAPVANIIGASSALNDVDVTEEEKSILKRAINTSVMKLDDVVQDLNHILQVKSSANETREIVIFSELVDDIKNSIQNLVKHDADINYDFADKNELLTIKPYLYSIFYNLISNSIKYCRPDIPCSIEIKSTVVKNTLQLIFKDNGLGIDMTKNGDQVFGLYKRFHENTEGKGMGLYMVKTQVEMLGGKINVTSEENIGTEFIVEFELND
ncbi:CHASE3 domain-containing protein [Mucilaginibacter sp. UYCu711]|uniref:CHASE3 domain-containing protein n=1 Tax=Mucilaginibacter sp. UYCu711 TaxID=3156339 RepID=UPI003D20EB6A